MFFRVTVPFLILLPSRTNSLPTRTIIPSRSIARSSSSSSSSGKCLFSTIRPKPILISIEGTNLLLVCHHHHHHYHHHRHHQHHHRHHHHHHRHHHQHINNIIIIITIIIGNIGAGKSTLLTSLRENYPQWIYIDEPVEAWSKIGK